jgi:hypothetical protein
VRFERAHLLLRHADHHHVRQRTPRAMFGDHVVFALPALECDQRDVVRGGVQFDRAVVAASPTRGR